MIRRAKPDELYVSGHALQDSMYICMYTYYVYGVMRDFWLSAIFKRLFPLLALA